MSDKEVYKGIKSFLEKVSFKRLERLTADEAKPELTKEEIKIVNDLAFKIGKLEFDKTQFKDKELKKLYGYAWVWLCIELLRRLGLTKINDDGIPKKTKRGKDVDYYLKAHKKT